MLKRFLILLLLMPALAHAESRGAYLARLGDCTSCHTAPGGKPFAGGYRVNSPFGPIYGTNITPDPEYGIGSYSFDDFSRAVRHGVRRDGTRLYPAMPYTSFSYTTDEDMTALYDYFMHEVEPVHIRAPQTHLPFPFNQRWGLWFWDWAFTSDTRFRPDTSRDTQWNRGAYLVQSLGHCSACHASRGLAYQEEGKPGKPGYLRGTVLDEWYAANLSGDSASGLGRWSEDDITEFLATGHSPGGVAFGSMTEVVENSTQYMTPEDRAAIAHYLKSLAAAGEPSSYHPGATENKFEHPGAGLYAGLCAGCHRQDGSGRLPRIPGLAGNAAVLSPDAISIIRIVLEGGTSPVTSSGPPSAKMPAFARLTDEEVADTVNFIRQSWGNDAAPVSAREVALLRAKLKE